jgi:hypothetical protein
MKRRDVYDPIPEIPEPSQFSTVSRKTRASQARPSYARSVPGSQARARAYGNSVLQPPQHRTHNHMNSQNRAKALALGAAAVFILGGLADRFVQHSNKSASVAGELEQNPQAVAHDLLRNGNDGVVTVQLRSGANVGDEANRIATNSASGEVDLILGAQQQGDTVGDPGVAIVPAGDLKAAQLHTAQPVTPQTLIEFEATRTIGQ